jgi:adenine-specific DNA methylase
MSTPAIHTIDLKEFPTTRYRGSKRKMLPWINSHLSGLEYESVLDLFGGTGSVSYMFKRMGKKVIYNDHLHFNHLIGKALIENDNVQFPAGEIEGLFSGNPETKFISETFSGIYYTDSENQQLDTLLGNIRNIKSGSYKQALAYYALFQACMVKRPFNLFHRANLHIRQSKVERSFGNKTTWEHPLEELMGRYIAEVNGAVFKGKHKCRSTCFDALDASTDIDLVYIDPPYLFNSRNNETSDYLGCYHFLEGLARHTEWGNLIDRNTKNLRIALEQKNRWIDKNKIFKSYDLLFEKFKNSTIVISYKKGGLPSIDFLRDKLKEHGRKVRMHTCHYKYALNHQNGTAEKNREVLLIAE